MKSCLRLSQGRCLATALLWTMFALCFATGVQAQGNKPNILVIMGDDIGWFNPRTYHQGVMGYKTPNIDRIAAEGVKFTDWYGQQSCTAGRAAFMTGQSPIRTGLTKVMDQLTAPQGSGK